MIHSLKVHNLFPFQSVDLQFDPGLNILTGESGTGKSALISALGLLLGGKGHQKMIRPESSLAYAEGEFNCFDRQEICDLLDSEEIYYDKENPLLIRRELFRTNKTRAFINDQVVSLSFLQKLGSFLMDLVSQNSHQELLSPFEQREIIDLFGDILSDRKAFSNEYKKLQELTKKLTLLRQEQQLEEEKKGEYTNHLQDILDAAIEKDEETTLSQEHTLLAHAQEIRGKSDRIYDLLSDQPQSLMTQMDITTTTLEEIEEKDPSTSEMKELAKSMQIQMQELTYLLRNYIGSIEPNPERLFQIEERLKTIETIKKKHGLTFDEIEEKKSYYQTALEAIASYDVKIDELTKKTVALEDLLDKKASALTTQRNRTAKRFQTKVTDELKTLNMPNALFEVAVTPKERSEYGDDKISFFFAANKGTKALSLKGVASGGELSRLLLSMKILIGQKENNKPLLFDEIDANVGGQTAALVGQKLKTLGQMRQVLCITHFVQVARCATSHYQLTKSEKTDVAKSTITKLNEIAREDEYQRMIGISIDQ